MTFRKQLALKIVVVVFWMAVVWIITLPPWGDNRPKWAKKYDRRAQPGGPGKSDSTAQRRPSEGAGNEASMRKFPAPIRERIKE